MRPDVDGPGPHTIIFQEGHQTAADAAWGLQLLRVSTTGDLEYEQRIASHSRVVRGRVDAERVRAVLTALSRTKFPDPPEAVFRPGALLSIGVDPPGTSVHINYFDGLKMVGYGDVIRDLSGLNNALLENDIEALAAWRFDAA